MAPRNSRREKHKKGENNTQKYGGGGAGTKEPHSVVVCVTAMTGNIIPVWIIISVSCGDYISGRF